MYGFAASMLWLVACAPPTPSNLATSSPPSTSTVPGLPATVGAPTPSVSQASPVPSVPVASTKLSVSYSALAADQLGLWVSQEGGYFTASGLDADLSQLNGQTSIPALLAGDLQIVHVGGSEVIAAETEGADLVVVAVLEPTFPFVFVGSPAIQSLADVKGKRLGVTQRGSSDDIALRAMLRQQGIDPDTDVTFVPLGGTSPNRLAALTNGVVDGALLVPELAAQYPEGHIVADLSTLDVGATNTVVAAKREWVAAHPDVMQAYVDALVAGIARMKADKAFSISVLKKYYQTQDEATLDPVYAFAARTQPTLPYPKAELFAPAQREMQGANDRLADFDVTTILDPSFVRSAADRHVAGASS